VYSGFLFPMKTFKEFNIYPDNEYPMMAKAVFIDGVYSGVKLMFKAGRSSYIHFINDAGLEAERLFL